MGLPVVAKQFIPTLMRTILDEDMAARWLGKLATWVAFVFVAWLCVGGTLAEVTFLMGAGVVWIGALVLGSYCLARAKLWWLTAGAVAARAARRLLPGLIFLPSRPVPPSASSGSGRRDLC